MPLCIKMETVQFKRIAPSVAGGTDKTCQLPSTQFHICAISTRGQHQTLEKGFWQYSKVVCCKKTKAFKIWKNRRRGWVSHVQGRGIVFQKASTWLKPWHVLKKSSFVDIEQQQCDWTKPGLWIPTVPGPLVPRSAKYQSITRLVQGSGGLRYAMSVSSVESVSESASLSLCSWSSLRLPCLLSSLIG